MNISTHDMLEIEQDMRQLEGRNIDLRKRIEELEESLSLLYKWVDRHPRDQAIGPARNWALRIIKDTVPDIERNKLL